MIDVIRDSIRNFKVFEYRTFTDNGREGIAVTSYSGSVSIPDTDRLEEAGIRIAAILRDGEIWFIRRVPNDRRLVRL